MSDFMKQLTVFLKIQKIEHVSGLRKINVTRIQHVAPT